MASGAVWARRCVARVIFTREAPEGSLPVRTAVSTAITKSALAYRAIRMAFKPANLQRKLDQTPRSSRTLLHQAVVEHFEARQVLNISMQFDGQRMKRTWLARLGAKLGCGSNARGIS